jgi:NADPH2:quinone reductase
VGDRICYTSGATYAQFTAINPDFAVKLPDSVSFETGASLLLQGLTAMALTRMVHIVKKGQVVLIHVIFT